MNKAKTLLLETQSVIKKSIRFKCYNTRVLVTKSQPSLNKSCSFYFKDYLSQHQSNSILDSLKVSYKYKDSIDKINPLKYPDFTQIYNYIDKYFVNYPNEADFWEILNKNLVTDLLTNPIPTIFGFDYKLADLVDNLTVKINVKSGSEGINIPRSSIVTGTPGEKVKLDESFEFSFKNYQIQHQRANFNLNVSYKYKNGIGTTDPFEYPDFIPIYNYIEKFLTNHLNETDFWEIVNNNLVNELLTELIPTPYGFEYNLANVVDNLTLKFDILAGAKSIDHLSKVQ